METDDFQIKGPTTLSGEVTTNTSKNGSVALLCASLINSGTTTLRGIAKIEEVFRVIEILESLGVEIKWQENHTVVINPPKKLSLEKIDKESAGKIRSLLMLLGPLSHLEKSFSLPHAGGCKMGERTIAAHRHALENMGLSIETDEESYKIKSGGKTEKDFTMYEASDTATINALLRAAKMSGETTIRFGTSNYQVQDVAFFLESLGVEIKGLGTPKIVVSGQKSINKNIEHYCSEDPIESMMWISAAATTKSSLLVKRCPIDFLRLELLKLEGMGLDVRIFENYKSKNNKTNLVDVKIKKSKLSALGEKIHALPYPGINTDNLPFFVPIATQAEGTTKILDWMWENRAIYFTELNRLGANITLADPHRVFIDGPTKLKATQIVCPPALRPSMIIMIAMLAAEGESILRNVYAIKRGYENIVERLNSVGADIKILNS